LRDGASPGDVARAVAFAAALRVAHTIAIRKTDYRRIPVW
jgi:hypothetical protein